MSKQPLVFKRCTAAVLTEYHGHFEASFAPLVFPDLNRSKVHVVKCRPVFRALPMGDALGIC